MPNHLYHVAPRYTAGSPAQVDRETAARVWIAELEAYAAQQPEGFTLSQNERAKQDLAGIVYATQENHEGTQVFVEDIIIDWWYVVPIARWREANWYERNDREQFHAREYER